MPEPTGDSHREACSDIAVDTRRSLDMLGMTEGMKCREL